MRRITRQNDFAISRGKFVDLALAHGSVHFIVLPQDEKAAMVWNQGVYLCMRPYRNGYLYGIDDFASRDTELTGKMQGTY